MAINKKQYITRLDLCNIVDIFGVSKHIKAFQKYIDTNLDDKIIHLFALEIATYAKYRFLLESDIAAIMTRIGEYITIEYESSESEMDED